MYAVVFDTIVFETLVQGKKRSKSVVCEQEERSHTTTL